ncbi:MAG: ATP-dependent RecD-like DNA helicase [Verrucomicrobiaceae bacterium]|nr:MAG: ATP-dependent RecD-like DNA helicase [Verrucomicrobiaceae bacterium]
MEQLNGTVERVTYHTEDTGYSVLKVKVRGRHEPVTVTGNVPLVHEGEAIAAEGDWVLVPEYGRQFKAQKIETTAPASREGIEKYLASGLIEGIGPVYAKKLVDKFGDEIFDVIEHNSARLQEVPGVGRKRRLEIKSGWEKQKSVREIMVFLHRHGISTGKAVKIFKQYGPAAMETVANHPYQLAKDIHGIGFKTADGIAQRTGLAVDSPERVRAGLFHLLLAAGSEGHTALPRAQLLTQAVELLSVAPEVLEPVLDAAVAGGELRRELIQDTELIFPPHLARAEEEIAARLKKLAAQPAAYPAIDQEKALAWVQRRTGKELAPGQAEAVRLALTSRVLVITGGPGVGKTTILQSILRILTAKNVHAVLAAPTGRAARRMAESTGMEAKTIHRLLEFAPGGEGFKKNAVTPLTGNLFVLDETSMVDVSLMAHYLRALPEGGHLLLVGDVDQLPSVGPGTVLKDLIDSGTLPVARLTEVFRQAAESWIIQAAHAINQGKIPWVPKPVPPDCDFHFIERDTPEAIAETLVHLARERIPNAFGMDPLRDIQVLCPMNRGLLGTANLNVLLQQALNPPGDWTKPEADRYGITYRQGDKVIQTRNNYDKDAFNGDIGRITDMAADPLEVLVEFEDGRQASYDSGDLDELRPAWAITIHKSQGSEFPAVVIPVSTQHYVMLQRNLLYTGVTRGRRLVILVGDPKALGIAVRTVGASKRWGGLLHRMTLEAK